MESPALAAKDAAPPLREGRFRLVSVLGSGGMATVYQAYDQWLDTMRAIKVLHPRLADSEVLRQRFLREARTMVKIRHPNVVAVHELGQEGDRIFIVMELMRGGSLEQLLRGAGALPPRRAVDIVLDILSGLEAVHAAGVVHRDVKPGNILIDVDGTPKVGDFGIARLSEEDGTGITRSGAAVGTWAYMAPEQRRSAKDVDARADLYAVAATLYALLSRQEPHDLDREELHSATMATFPAPLQEVLLRATRYHPADRYESAAAMRRALLAIREALPPMPPDGPGGEPPHAPADPGTPLHSPLQTPVPLSRRAPSDPAPRLRGGASTAYPLPERRWSDWAAPTVGLALLAALALAVVRPAAPPPPADGSPGISVSEPEIPAPSVDPLPPEPEDIAGDAQAAPPAEEPIAAEIPGTGAPAEPSTPAVEPAPPEKRPPQARVTSTAEASTAEPAPVRTDPPPTQPEPIALLSAAPPLPEAPAEPAAPAMLFVRSNPVSKLFIDGQEIFSLDLIQQSQTVEPGAHRVSLVQSNGETHSWDLTLSPGQLRSLCWDFDAKRTGVDQCP